ncbi:putative membrane protein [Brevibacterium pityocampae]
MAGRHEHYVTGTPADRRTGRGTAGAACPRLCLRTEQVHSGGVSASHSSTTGHEHDDAEFGDSGSDGTRFDDGEGHLDPGARSRGPWFMDEAKLGVFLVVSSVIGFLASFELSIDKVRLLENPSATLSCDFNPFFSCGSVMAFEQSQIFGFPNQFLGIAAFIFPLLLGVLLITRTRVPGWVMVGLNLGLLAGTVLVMYLYYSSIFVIGIGCPWCIVVWTVTIPLFCVVTGYNVIAGNLGAGLRDNGVVRAIAGTALIIAVLWLILVYASIVFRFWVFFGSLVG